MIGDEYINNIIASRQKILIADDAEINRAILADMLEDEYDIIEAQDGIEAINVLRTVPDIDLVLLDIMMPHVDGFEVLTAMNQYHWIDDIPVIMISTENSPSYVNKAYGLGVTDYINRPFDEIVVRRRVVNTLMLYGKQKRLAKLVTDQIYEGEKQSVLMVNILSHIVEFHNGESGPHVLHICALTRLLLNCLVQKSEKYNLSYSDISLISTAASLHDIGKITIPESIINKPGKLTSEEFKIMQQHSMAGADMLDALPFYKNEPIVKISYEICRWHHERYDGKGYPDGLKGDDIPISAQIVSLADVYDALTSERVYKAAFTHEKALQMILNGECGTFNPLLLECLLEIEGSIQEELKGDPLQLAHGIELRNVSIELSRHKELSASERTLHLLERERTKYQFLALMSREIQFEYVEATHLVTISDWGAKELNLKEAIANPYQSEELLQVLGIENLKELDTLLRNTTPESPDIQKDFQIMVNNEPRWYHFLCRATWQEEDTTPQYLGAVGKVIDNHDEHNRFLELEHKANHDSLTQLLTHSFAKEQIKKILQNSPTEKYALILLDLDNFKEVNDTYGHMFGDKILCHAAQCIQESLEENSIAARIGGDEFSIFIKYQDSPETFANTLFKAIGHRYRNYNISVSIGVSTSEAADTYETLFKQADQALYAAKSAGRKTYRLYDDTMRNMFSSISSIDSEAMKSNV